MLVDVYNVCAVDRYCSCVGEGSVGDYEVMYFYDVNRCTGIAVVVADRIVAGVPANTAVDNGRFLDVEHRNPVRDCLFEYAGTGPGSDGTEDKSREKRKEKGKEENEIVVILCSLMACSESRGHAGVGKGQSMLLR